MIRRDTLRSRVYPNIGARPVRADASPGHPAHADGGCEVASRCLECPLPACKYDAGGLQKMRLASRDAEIVRLKEDGLSTTEVARRLQVDGRTVARVFARSRAA